MKYRLVDVIPIEKINSKGKTRKVNIRSWLASFRELLIDVIGWKKVDGLNWLRHPEIPNMVYSWNNYGQGFFAYDSNAHQSGLKPILHLDRTNAHKFDIDDKTFVLETREVTGVNTEAALSSFFAQKLVLCLKNSQPSLLTEVVK